MRRLSIAIILFFICFSAYCVNVKDYPDIHAAYNATPNMGTLFFPVGTWRLTQPLIIDRLVNIKGEGKGSIILADGFDAIIVDSRMSPTSTAQINISHITIANLKNAGNLLSLYRVIDGAFTNINLRGGDKGIYIKGSLRNTFFLCHTDTGYWSSMAPMPLYGVYSESDSVTRISNNANRFIACNMRSCQKAGYYITEGRGEGSFTLRDSTIEGCGMGLYVAGMTTGVGIHDCHFEANDIGIRVENVAVGKIDVIYNTDLLRMDGCPNFKIENSYLSGVETDAASSVSVDGVMLGSKYVKVSETSTLKHLTSATGSQVMPATPTSTTAKNLVAGDLEQWDDLPAGLERYDTGTIQKTDMAKFGKHGAKITSRGSNAGLAFGFNNEQYEDVKGKKVTVSAYFRSDYRIMASIYVRFYGGADYFVAPREEVTDTWKRLIYSFRMDEKASSCRIIWGLYRQMPGKAVYVDGLEVVVGDEASPIYDDTSD